MAKRITASDVPAVVGTIYPPPFDAPCLGRARRRLGNAAGLTQFGVNQTTIPPGGWSNQRHWHAKEDEFVYVLAGELVLITDDGEELLRAGDCAGFRAGDPNGHHLVNRSDDDAVVLEIGTRDPAERATYSDIDMIAEMDPDAPYKHKDGTPYPKQERRSG